MLRSLGDPALCRGHASRDFVDIGVHFFVKSCSLDFASAVFYNDSCMILLTFSMTSRLLLRSTFVALGARGTFAACRATLVVKSQGRLLRVSLFRAIAVSPRATLSAKSRGRPSLCGVNCTFMCLKSRTVVSEVCPMCPKSRTVASKPLSLAPLGLPRDRPSPGPWKSQFGRPPENVAFSIQSLL